MCSRLKSTHSLPFRDKYDLLYFNSTKNIVHPMRNNILILIDEEIKIKKKF